VTAAAWSPVAVGLAAIICAASAATGVARGDDNPPPHGGRTHYLRSPTGNIVCSYSGGRGLISFAGCTMKSTVHRGWFRNWEIWTRGRVLVEWAPLVMFPRSGRTLRYGHAISINKGVRCISRRTGWTCTNRSGHGYFLSRQRQRIW